MANNRSYNSIKNSIYAMIGQVVTIALNFISRTIFIHTLGVLYLGLNGLFTNLLSVLSFAELGFSTAIVYEMYATLAKGNEMKVSALMNFYAKVYRYIGIFIFLAGIVLIPFLNSFIKDPASVPQDMPPLWVIYLLFLGNTSVSYFFNYKRSIIVASQNGYLDSLNQMRYNIIRNVLQIAVLYILKSFVLFLIIQVVCTFLSNISISLKADKIFPYLKKYKGEKIESDTIHSIKKNVFAMTFNKLGGVAVGGINNLLVAKFVGLVAVGCYSNYLLVVNTLRTVFIQLFTPITASVGNFVALKTQEESYQCYRNILFVNAYLAIEVTVCLATLINPFISVFWGDQYVFSSLMTLAIVLNFYVDRMRQASQMFIDVSGLFWQIKWRSACEALLTVALALIFLLYFDMGLMGVLLGILFVNVFVNLWWEAYVVYKNLFRYSLLSFLILQMVYFFILGLCYIIIMFIISNISNDIIGLILKTIIAFVVSNFILILLTAKTKEFKYFKNIILNLIRKKL